MYTWRAWDWVKSGVMGGTNDSGSFCFLSVDAHRLVFIADCFVTDCFASTNEGCA
jgi:hypothetical protein